MPGGAYAVVVPQPDVQPVEQPEPQSVTYGFDFLHQEWWCFCPPQTEQGSHEVEQAGAQVGAQVGVQAGAARQNVSFTGMHLGVHGAGHGAGQGAGHGAGQGAAHGALHGLHDL